MYKTFETIRDLLREVFAHIFGDICIRMFTTVLHAIGKKCKNFAKNKTYYGIYIMEYCSH